MAGPRLIAALLLMLWLCSNPFGTQTRKGLDYGNRGYVREADTPTDSCHNLCHDPERVERDPCDDGDSPWMRRCPAHNRKCAAVLRTSALHAALALGNPHQRVRVSLGYYFVGFHVDSFIVSEQI